MTGVQTCALPISKKKALEYMRNSGKKSYNKAIASHVDFYKKYFDRVSLNLGTNDQAKKTTDVRVNEFASTFDPQMSALYFQFGRYLLISCSQPEVRLLIYREYGIISDVRRGTVNILRT